MNPDADFFARVGKLQDEVRQLPDIGDAALIEQTAQRLEKLNYTPATIVPVRVFLRLNKEALLEEVGRILRMTAAEIHSLTPNDPKSYRQMQEQYISVLVYYFKQLSQLRSGDPQSWDEVDELYVHD